MRRRTAHTAFALAAAACAALAGVNAARLVRARHINSAIASHGSLDRTVPEAQIARAIALAKAGDDEGAMLAYKTVVQGERTDLRRLAMYNLGNLHLRAALKKDLTDADQRLPLIELAKQSYRDLLRQTPDDWDARYNLERALYLSPEGEEETADEQPPAPKEHSVSTVRAKMDLP